MGTPLFAIPDQLAHLLPTYIAELTADIGQLQALADGPGALLAEHTHAMGGKCAMFGDAELAEMLYAVEFAALADSEKGVSDLVTAALNRAQQALDSLK